MHNKHTNDVQCTKIHWFCPSNVETVQNDGKNALQRDTEKSLGRMIVF